MLLNFITIIGYLAVFVFGLHIRHSMIQSNATGDMMPSISGHSFNFLQYLWHFIICHTCNPNFCKMSWFLGRVIIFEYISMTLCLRFSVYACCNQTSRSVAFKTENLILHKRKLRYTMTIFSLTRRNIPYWPLNGRCALVYLIHRNTWPDTQAKYCWQSQRELDSESFCGIFRKHSLT